MKDGPWWVEPVATGLSIIVSAAMIVWQQRTTSINELRFKLFEEMRLGLDVASNSVIASGMYAFLMSGNIRTYRNLLAAGQFAAVPESRIPKLNELHFAALNKITELMRLLEGHEIVSEHFELFRRALGCANQDAGDAFNRLTPLLYKAVPIDVPGASGPHIPNPTDAEFQEFSDGCIGYWQRTNTLVSYIHDIKVEAQNVLLGGLFRRRAPSRRPADPRMWVLRTDDPEYLARVTRFFTEEHPVAANGIRLTAEAERAAITAMEAIK